MYAVIKTGGRQYKVAENDVLKVNRVDIEPGNEHVISDVTLVENNGDVTLGTPFIKGAKVTTEVVKHVRGPKLVVFFYRHKTTHKRRKGHRQELTELRVKSISLEA
ncbi:MAG TPA: 50S ribosomal protein L21 [Caldisericia bacterium]|nr:50S ribosomal protein L21 [Caldisericia bacterium]HPF48919.1 50S ribosomal protein L21 [Caldisericia bacterium]HPI83217.1 50S ribosomal protein L21 [Caldisericia bacterium]HPQ92444.1 50S ribosomal protein L21 [Caldisericia bacterium]HRV74458.1 50S ribosomal protein L21 [Caldisericia bacterium]